MVILICGLAGDFALNSSSEKRGEKVTQEERILGIIRENIEGDYSLTLDTDLEQELDIDSLDTIMIVNAMEDEFSIKINEADFRHLKTVKDMVKALKEKYLS